MLKKDYLICLQGNSSTLLMYLFWITLCFRIDTCIFNYTLCGFQDWWNSKSFLKYYRTWNNLVQDWLYFYLYKDILLFIPNKKMAKILVVFISSVFHEYILSVALKVFFPVIFILFFGNYLCSVTVGTIENNIVFLYTVSFGFVLNIVLYTVAYDCFAELEGQNSIFGYRIVSDMVYCVNKIK